MFGNNGYATGYATGISSISSYPSIAYGSYNYNNYLNHNDYNGYFYNNSKSNYFDSLIDYLDEEDIQKMIQVLQDRGESKDIIKGIVNSAIQKRHFSEDFLLAFSDILDMQVVKQHYSSDIKTQAYPRIALLVQAE